MLTTIPGEVLVPKYAKSFAASITADPKLFSPVFRVIAMANAETGADDAIARANEAIAATPTSMPEPLRLTTNRGMVFHNILCQEPQS